MADTFRRIINSFSVEERPQIVATLLGSLRLVVSQRLYEKADGGGRVAVREILPFTADIREILLDTPLERLQQRTEQFLNDGHGLRMQDDARRAYEAGLISAVDYKSVLAERREADTTGITAQPSN